MTETSSPQPSQTPENVVGNQEAASSRPDVARTTAQARGSGIPHNSWTIFQNLRKC